MPHTRVKFLHGHDDGDDHEEVKGWHLLAQLFDGEYTACGLAITEYETTEEQKEKAGITCQKCLDVVRYYKSIKL